ncbi:MAG TPA: RICIN domain-containing protein, partial [Pirellulales bacterium]
MSTIPLCVHADDPLTKPIPKQQVARLGFDPSGKLYMIVQVHTGKVLGIFNDSDADGQQAMLVDDDIVNQSRQWTIKNDGDFIKFINQKSEKALDVFGGHKTDETPIIQWHDKSVNATLPAGDANGGFDNQFWIWDGQGNERRIKNKFSELVLDIDDTNHIVQR